LKNEPTINAQGRLQRTPDFTGEKITQFKQVIIRHLVPALFLSLLCLISYDLRVLLVHNLETANSNPSIYLLGFSGLVLFFTVAATLSKRLNLQQLYWVIYLFAISVTEEWVYRLAVPGILENVFTPITAAVIANLVFAAVHYFTLRWRLIWCIGVFCGAMGLSRLMVREDLMLVIYVHWLFTYLNTPKPPS